jgi:hypothetical protein
MLQNLRDLREEIRATMVGEVRMGEVAVVVAATKEVVVMMKAEEEVAVAVIIVAAVQAEIII